MAATEVGINLAEIKAWFEGFTPSNEREERFKSAVKEALENVTQDFKVMYWCPVKWVPGKTRESYTKELESLGLRPGSPHEYCLLCAQMVAAGDDAMWLYFAMEYYSSRRPEYMDLSDISASVNLIMSEKS